MNNYTLQKKLLELKELYGKNIDKMDKVLFLKNIKSNLEIFYFTREMSNLTFYGLIKESFTISLSCGRISRLSTYPLF